MKQQIGIRIITITFFVILSINHVFGERYIPNARHPDYPGKCYHKETNYAMEVGETYKPKGICEKFYCRDDFIILVNFCPRYNVPDGCKPVQGDQKESFPKCCAKLICTDRNGNKDVRETAYD